MSDVSNENGLLCDVNSLSGVIEFINTDMILISLNLKFLSPVLVEVCEREIMVVSITTKIDKINEQLYFTIIKFFYVHYFKKEMSIKLPK